MINNETTSRVIHHRVVTKHSTHDTNELADSQSLTEWSTQPITGDKTPQHSSELYSITQHTFCTCTGTRMHLPNIPKLAN